MIVSCLFFLMKIHNLQDRGVPKNEVGPQLGLIQLAGARQWKKRPTRAELEKKIKLHVRLKLEELIECCMPCTVVPKTLFQGTCTADLQEVTCTSSGWCRWSSSPGRRRPAWTALKRSLAFYFGATVQGIRYFSRLLHG
jgi:hypothetical protein